MKIDIDKTIERFLPVLVFLLMEIESRPFPQVPYYVRVLSTFRIKYKKIKLPDSYIIVDNTSGEYSTISKILPRHAAIKLAGPSTFDVINLMIKNEYFIMLEKLNSPVFIRHKRLPSKVYLYVTKKKFTKLKLMGLFDDFD